MSGKWILVIDDNPQNLKLLRVLLLSEGYQVRTAADAEEGLRILTSFTAHLVLMDLQLPGMDGLELTRRLKSDPALGGVIVIALTAYAMKGDREKALAAGCDDYVSKPINSAGLLEIIAAHLARRLPQHAVEKSWSSLAGEVSDARMS